MGCGGCFFMCRQNQLWGLAAIAFGLGILLGGQLESGFGASVLAFGAIIFGFSQLWKK